MSVGINSGRDRATIPDVTSASGFGLAANTMVARRTMKAALPQRVRLGERLPPLDGAIAEAGLARPRHFWLKRSIDIVVALAGAALYLPIMAVAVLAVQLVDPGPVFYVQDRRGLHGHPIKVWKLRTMYADAATRLEQYLAADPAARREWRCCFKLRRDPRILPGIGRFLRQSSIDELPQIWNLIRGDMTLVGPRPLPDYHLAVFDQDFRRLRQSVLPGLTGLWQVRARSDGDHAVLRHLDSYYVGNVSMTLDLEILLLTVGAVLIGRGAR